MFTEAGRRPRHDGGQGQDARRWPASGSQPSVGAPAGSSFCSRLISHCLTVSEGQDPALLYCPSARLPGCCRAVTTGVSSEGLTGEGSAPCPRGRWQSSVPQGLLEGGASSSAGAGWRPPPCLAPGLPLANMAGCFIRASKGKSPPPRRKSLSFEICWQE